VAARDAQLGLPDGREYMLRLAARLPSGKLNDQNPNPINWNVRVNDKAGIPLSLVLAYQDSWTEAITDLLGKPRQPKGPA
jgi:hypothetical protein